ncbi:MAG: ADOP family duplicated permease [Gemmatimonadota bacterium]
MGITSDMATRLSALFRRRRMERELDEELAFHLEREVEKLAAEGLDPDRARTEALRRFGGVQHHRERARASWGLVWLDDLWRDLRIGARGLRRARGFTAVAVTTMGLGIGGTLALYGAIHALLVRPFPFPAGDRVEVFWSDQNWRGSEFDHVREGVVAFEEVAAYGHEVVTLGEGRGRAPVAAVMGSAGLFDVLGAAPLLGRTFREGEDRPGAEPVIVLSHGLWQQRYGGNPGVVGRLVSVDGVQRTIVGVMPAGFFFPSPDQRAWVPLDLDPADGAYAGNGWLILVGRRANGASNAQVEAEIQGIAARLGERFTYSEEWDKTRGAFSVPLRTYLFGEVGPLLRLLTLATALLLVMALANVSALLLGRMIDRAHEMRLRAALGAGRARLVRQIVAESVLLSGIAGGVGVALAYLGFGAVVSRLPLGGGFETTIGLDWRLLVAALAGATLLGALVALAPAHRLLRDRPTNLQPGARAEGGAAAGRSGRLQAALVSAQVVIAVTLVAGATLFARSAAQLYRVDTGLDPAGVGAVTVGVDRATPGGGHGFARRAVDAARALPGVEYAAMGLRLPLRDGGIQGSTGVRDRPELDGANALSAYYRAITDEYLTTMGMRVVEGRGFGPEDRAGAAPVTLVNRAFAEEVWPGESALGKSVMGNFDDDWSTVVGVVDNVPIEGVRAPAPRVVYRPYEQWAALWPGGVLTFRTSGDPAALLETVRRTLEELDATAVVLQPTTLRRALDASIADVLRLRFFMAALAALALAIGAVGVYGVVSYEVARRSREFGIRMALGADRGRLVREVMRRESVQVLIGVAVGVGLATLAARAAAGLVWGVQPVDPPSLAAGAGALLAVGVVAALTPAIRASRVDPARVLRGE